ncbi:MAG: MMPL family transporter [Chitinophagaceae bacterium]|nr:MMPL family transporter [Chitinophagaceae bacterium]
MAFFASKVEMSYEFTQAIPKDNNKYKAYVDFKKIFGEDGTMMVIAFEKDNIFQQPFFSLYNNWIQELKKIKGVNNVLSIPESVGLYKTKIDGIDKLETKKIFEGNNLDSAKVEFLNFPFYKNLLYNGNVYLTAVYLNPDIIKSKKRVALVNEIEKISNQFAQTQKLELHYSGLPFIRTKFAENVKNEMKLILFYSLLLTSIILILFFRSASAVIFSLLVVIIGVIWSTAFIYLLGFKITLLTALIPPLVVVIGLPNCVYFLTKYHSLFAKNKNKHDALLGMVSSMGIVTLFTNLTAMIGFGVFYFTQSQILKEFGLVAGINIGLLFLISIMAIPSLFSYLPPPKERHLKYMENNSFDSIILKIQQLVFNKQRQILIITGVVLLISFIGISFLQNRAFVVDDLPKEDVIYKDLKYFEKNFGGVMPLEIIVDTKKKGKAVSLPNISKIDAFTNELKNNKEIGKSLSFIELLKFAKQAFYNGDSNHYQVPNMYDAAFIQPYLKMENKKSENNQFGNLLNSFIDSTKQKARISVNIADIGSQKLNILLNTLTKKANEIFDTSKTNIVFTGTSVVFLEGSKFIINSLGESIVLALIMIVLCILFLFKNIRIVVIAITINCIPLIITAGIMGLTNIPLKPSTVLVFSIAMGIAIDVTIRFLVNYKQELPRQNFDIKNTLLATIKETGLSIIFTSLILAGGFIVFIFSQFDGTKAIGLLISITLLLAMIINLTLLPVLLSRFEKYKKG